MRKLRVSFGAASLTVQRGLSQANLKRVIPSDCGHPAGHPDGSVFSRIVGNLDWLKPFFFFRRRLLSLLNVSYAASSTDASASHVIRLSTELKEEMFLFLALATSCNALASA